MFKDVYHIGYQTDDADAAIAFCERAFGGRVTNQSNNPDGARLVFIPTYPKLLARWITASSSPRVGRVPKTAWI